MGLKETLKKNRIIYSIVSKTKECIKKQFMLVLNFVFRVEDKKIVFISWAGKSYSDNPRAISEKLHQMAPEFKIVWLFQKPEDLQEVVPSYIKCVKNHSLKAVKELATAKFWVDNFPKYTSIYKNKRQIYIQTHHGDRGFKKIFYDSPFQNQFDRYIESEICDLMIAGSEFGVKKLTSAYHYQGAFLKVGSPRNDLLVKNDQETANKIKDTLRIPLESKILLYAPTYRRENNGNIQNISGIDINLIRRKLENADRSQWVCLVRGHGNTTGLQYEPELANAIMDVTDYQDMADILLITDYLITDYSTSSGDFILKKKPVILYQPDREEYISKDRTFYFDIDKSPFFVARTQDEILNLIDRLDVAEAQKNCEQIIKFYGVFESGEASDEIVQYIIEKVKHPN